MLSHDLINSEYGLKIVALQLQEMGLKFEFLTEISGLKRGALRRHSKKANISRNNSPKGTTRKIEWFFETTTRQDQSCIALKLYREYEKDNHKALALLKTYESYRELVSSPTLTINHIATITRNYLSGNIHIETCSKCRHMFLSLTDEVRINCPHCFIEDKRKI